MTDTEKERLKQRDRHREPDAGKITISGRSATPLAEDRVREGAKMIVQGKSREDILDFFKGMGFAPSTAKDYLQAAARYLIPKDEDSYREEMVAANFNRLEGLLKRTLEGEDKDLRLAKDIIAEMNKMLVGYQKVAIEKNKDGDERIVISFDN